MNCRREVAIEQAAGKDLAGVPGAIKLELVHAVFRDHVEAGAFEQVVVLWRGERKAAIQRLVSVRFACGDPLLFRFLITAPRREPDANPESITCRRLTNSGKSVWQPRIKLPDLVRVVPSIVKEEGVHGDAAPAY